VLINDLKFYWFIKFNGSLFSLFTVDDASGHYTTGYFWGNNYWTGSLHLCQSIYKTDYDEFFDKKESSNGGLTFLDGSTRSSRLKHKNPPFLPRFGVLKVFLNETYTTPTVRTSFLYNIAKVFKSV
jgi:hypothetical protein